MTPDLFKPTPRILAWIMLSLGLVVLPHVMRVPLWVSVLFAGLIAWRYYLGVRGLQVPPAWVRTLLGIAVLTGIILHYRTMFGQEAGVALLTALTGIKILELHNRRDAMLTIFLGYFLIITNFLYSQAIVNALYLLMVMVVMTAALVTFNDVGNSLNTPRRLRLAGNLVGQGLPLMLTAFILFPRVEGPFWRLPEDVRQGITALSDTMSPGSISQLSQSDAVAFRVKVEQGEMPPPAQRYWRGPVFWQFDGRSWKQNKRPDPPLPVIFEGEPVRYTVTLEAHNQHWLYALDLPAKAPRLRHTRLTADYQLFTRMPRTARVRYTLDSYSRYRMERLDQSQQRRGLRLPSTGHEQARALAAQWRDRHVDPAAVVARALRYFREAPFVYTLHPPLLLNDPVDEFLFDTRRGFCEHYAGAFTVLMRAAGIPARVVTGYQGGERNPLGDYWIIRQRDAHAWSEVWLAGRGWVRVDPTAAVSPERVETGIAGAIPQVPAVLGFTVSEQSALHKFLRQARNSWDALNNGWNQWVLGYGPATQRAFLQWLGLSGGYRAMVTTLVAISATLLLGLGIWLVRDLKLKPRDPAQRLYARFCRQLSRRGLPRGPHEGPLDFSRRAARHFPEQAPRIHEIGDLYAALRYQGRTDKLPALTTAVKAFRV